MTFYFSADLQASSAHKTDMGTLDDRRSATFHQPLRCPAIPLHEIYAAICFDR